MVLAALARRSLPGAPFGTSPTLGIHTSPTQTGIPIPRFQLPVDRFPSFIVIASPSVIATTLNFLLLFSRKISR
jgi:hypothetical protein